MKNRIYAARTQRRLLQKENEKWPVEGRDIPRDQWPRDQAGLIRVVRSRDYLVQVFQEPCEVLRLSICRTVLLTDGLWDDGIAWDELQAIKQNLGYDDWWGVEIFPPARSTVNVANMRHLWLTKSAPDYAWRRNA